MTSRDLKEPTVKVVSQIYVDAAISKTVRDGVSVPKATNRNGSGMMANRMVT